ncbi:GIY-YIG nuclease family protein [Candidatus Kaiserbacteria bacterium]|nr:GIY-YIG nuclease family protein [Candidatus Kaiserbacteria bacterium]
MAFAYILESQKDGSYYIGSASTVSTRLEQHNAGVVRSTKARRPWILRFAKKCDTVSEARKLEARLKSWKKRAAIENFMNRESSMVKVGP